MATFQLHRMEASLETKQRIHISWNLVVMKDLLCWVPGQGIVWPMEHGVVSGQYVKVRYLKVKFVLMMNCFGHTPWMKLTGSRSNNHSLTKRPDNLNPLRVLLNYFSSLRLSNI